MFITIRLTVRDLFYFCYNNTLPLRFRGIETSTAPALASNSLLKPVTGGPVCI